MWRLLACNNRNPSQPPKPLRMVNKMKKSEKVNMEGLFVDPLLSRPSRVALVALGPSCRTFVRESLSNPTMDDPFDQVWTLNRGIRGFQHDLLFCMDDLKWLERKNKGYTDYLKNHDKPIITSTVYPDYPMSVAYPLQEVLETITDDVFTVNTVAYMLAYAIHIRVKETTVYGADFVYPNGNTAEFGGQAVAYLMGMMRHFDLIHRIPGDSTMLYANKVKPGPNNVIGRIPYYGYHRLEQMAEEEEKENARKRSQKASRKKGKK